MSAIGRPGFTLIGFIYVTIALHIHPRRVPGCWYVALAAWAIFHMTSAWRFGLANTIAGHIGAPTPRTIVIADFLAEVPTLLLLLGATRSWRLVCVLAAATTLCAVNDWRAAPTRTVAIHAYRGGNLFLVGSTLPFFAWHGAVCAVMLGWAVWNRSRYRTPGTCPSCGYDIRSTNERCPECGTSQGST